MTRDIKKLFIFFKVGFRFFSLVIFGIYFFSCQQDTTKKEKRVFPEYGIWMDSILLSKEKIIRGCEPGSTLEDVFQMEKRPAVEQDSSSVYFELTLDSIMRASLNYSLENQVVQEIDLTVTANNEMATQIFNDLKLYFTSRFGEPVTEKGISVFSAFSSAGDNVKISLQDLSSTESGKISVLVYSEK